SVSRTSTRSICSAIASSRRLYCFWAWPSATFLSTVMRTSGVSSVSRRLTSSALSSGRAAPAAVLDFTLGDCGILGMVLYQGENIVHILDLARALVLHQAGDEALLEIVALEAAVAGFLERGLEQVARGGKKLHRQAARLVEGGESIALVEHQYLRVLYGHVG